jgi:hypothetical protein
MRDALVEKLLEDEDENKKDDLVIYREEDDTFTRPGYTKEALSTPDDFWKAYKTNWCKLRYTRAFVDILS